MILNYKSGSVKNNKKIAEKKTQLLLNHKKKPGPQKDDTLAKIDLDYQNAAKIIEFIDNGTILPKSVINKLDKKVKHPNFQDRLTMKDEQDLATRIRMWGDIEARNKLIMANLGLVHLVASQFYRPSIRHEDLLQEGTIGLLRATETFDPDRGLRFSTYATFWVKAKMQRMIKKQEKEDMPSIHGASLIKDEAGNCKRAKSYKLSLESSPSAQENTTLENVIADKSPTPEEYSINKEYSTILHRVIDEIIKEKNDDRLPYLINNRLLAENPETLEQIGNSINLSREGTRLLENKLLAMAKKRLKKLLIDKSLK